MSINILSQETINKIAAGEIVERPLSVVKELVENSLDAFSSSITVEVEESGKRIIRVSDDGFGMNKQDLELSILRHATSKIESFDDLSHIHSLGFRGEALASIASVSNFEIKTKEKGESFGWKLSTEGGKNVKIVPWAGSGGTITKVKDLFFNTPARLKFLKSNATERSRIISSLEEMALANNDITFKMLSENKTVFYTLRTNNKMDRIMDVLGKDFADSVKNTEIDHSKALIDIYFTNMKNSLPNRKYQYFFVNSRPINYPKWLIHCVYQAYKESIPHNKHPGILIYVTIDPAEIDVNIHPAKREVKFANENGIYNIIYRTLRNAVKSHGNFEIPINFSTIANISKHGIKTDIKNNSDIVSCLPSFDCTLNLQQIGNYNKEDKHNYISSKQTCSADTCINMYAKHKSKLYEKYEKIDDSFKIVGQIFNTYILVENKCSLYIFDQHAVAERIRYEHYIAQVKYQIVKIQQMLIPENFDLSSSDSELLKANINLFNELGIIIEEFGQNSFRVTGYPALLCNISIEQIVKTIIAEMEDDKIVEIEQKRDKIIRLACKASVRAGDSISFIESEKLVNDLFKCKYPFTCPHGRPTVYKIFQGELAKFFRRK
jgi:DNA mismatch repair protein MutL